MAKLFPEADGYTSEPDFRVRDTGRRQGGIVPDTFMKPAAVLTSLALLSGAALAADGKRRQERVVRNAETFQQVDFAYMYADFQVGQARSALDFRRLPTGRLRPPNTHRTRIEAEEAVASLNTIPRRFREEPEASQIQNELVTLGGQLPDTRRTTTFNGQPVDSHTFDSQRTALDRIRSQVEAQDRKNDRRKEGNYTQGAIASGEYVGGGVMWGVSYLLLRRQRKKARRGEPEEKK